MKRVPDCQNQFNKIIKNMKKFIIAISFVSVTFAFMLGIVSYHNTNVNLLLMSNIEALTDSESISDGESYTYEPGKIIIVGPELAIICGMKNRAGGLSAGCKRKDNSTCTVKITNIPSISF